MIEHYLNYLSVEKRYSHHTITSYKKDLTDFSVFVLENESQKTITNVSKKIIRNFVIYLHSASLSKRSTNRKLSSLRGFYNFLLKINEIPVSPMEGISSLKFYPEKQIGFSVSEMESLNSLPELTFEDLLDKVIIESLYQTGMRKAEFCNLKQKEVDFHQKAFKITGKGNKQRIVPISDHLIRILIKYQSFNNEVINPEDYFFINSKGKKINEKFVYKKVNSYLGLVSLKKKKSPHMLRHTFATHLLNSGAEITKVKKLLGHSSLASTQVYTEVNRDVLKHIMNQSHPLNNDNKTKKL